MGRTFLALALLGSALATTANAASSASITIQSTVMINAGLEITPQSGYNSLNILGGVNQQIVAIVNEHSNGKNGYIVTLQSVNANARSSTQATLNGTGANTDQVTYSIAYNNQLVRLDSTGTATVTSTTKPSSRAGETKSVQVTIAPAWVRPDTYSDTLILTLRNNN